VLQVLALVVVAIVLVRLVRALVLVAVGVLVCLIRGAFWLVEASARRMTAASRRDRATIRRRLVFDVPPGALPRARAASVAWESVVRSDVDGRNRAIVELRQKRARAQSQPASRTALDPADVVKLMKVLGRRDLATRQLAERMLRDGTRVRAEGRRARR